MSSDVILPENRRVGKEVSSLGLLILLAGFQLNIGLLSAQAIPGWNLVWSDEFSQVDGSLPDPSKWGYDIGGSGWGNSEIQYYTSRAENARIQAGELMIEAREENFGGRNHTSARLLTKGKWAWNYGRFEARVKVPSGVGLWPAFWMLGAAIDRVGWPNCGEIDIMEFVGRLPRQVFGTIHGPGYSGGSAVGGTWTLTSDVSDDYHVFVVEWDPGLIRWFVDGINYFSATPASLGANQWVFDHDHFLILNLAIDGNFAGPLDPAVTFPKQMLVDYVRVYSREQIPGANFLVNPGFEAATLSSWTGYSLSGVNENGGYIESTDNQYYNGGNPGGDNVLTHSGRFTAKVFGDFDGSENYNGFYQELEATAGTKWKADGWALTHPQDLMSGTNSAWIEVSFRDAADTVLALYRSSVLTTSNITAGSWMSLEVTDQLDPNNYSLLGTVAAMEAPAGTTKLRYQVVFRQPAFEGGSMYFDDLNLVQVVAPIVPPEFRASIRPGTVVSWTESVSGSSHQPQSSSDNVIWENLGPLIDGGSAKTVFDADGAAFYRVLENTPSMVGNTIANPGFETTEPASYPSPGAANWIIASPQDTNPSNGSASMSVVSSYGAYSPHGGASMLVIESTTPPSPASVVVPQTNVRSELVPLSGGSNHDLSFFAAHVLKVGGANPQFNLRFYNGERTFIGESGYESFASIGASWTKVEKNFNTPAGAAWMSIEWIQALGAGNDWHWVTLVDDVELLGAVTPGGQSVLLATAAAGLEISWDTEIGFVYQVEATDNLDEFLPLGSMISGDGGPAAMLALSTAPAKFYRVKKSMAP